MPAEAQPNAVKIRCLFIGKRVIVSVMPQLPGLVNMKANLLPRMLEDQLVRSRLLLAGTKSPHLRLRVTRQITTSCAFFSKI